MLLSEIIDKYPGRPDIEAKYKEAAGRLNKKIVVLDDDPTGVQTVHGVSVYTDWSYESILNGFQEDACLFFVLTNSRSFTKDETKRVHEEIGAHIVRASRETNKEYLIISRGDSTLRGHYPLETETLKTITENASGKPVHGEIIAPFFPEGGRYTIDNIHYANTAGVLIPCGETEFAADKTFGYKASRLDDWIIEKTENPHVNIISISLDELRFADIKAIRNKLLSVENFDKIIINAVSYNDLKVFTIAFEQALLTKRYIMRTAAGMVKIVGGISDKDFLTKKELICSGGGLIIIGSHVQKTTRQLERLKELNDICFIEFNQHLVTDESLFDAEIERVTALADDELKKGATAAIYTRRERLDFPGDSDEQLKISVTISEALVDIVKGINERPGFIIAKGGITSSDIGVKGLNVKKACVAGQIRPGVPVWSLGAESRFPGMPYIIFPGNVGDDDTLKDIAQELKN